MDVNIPGYTVISRIGEGGMANVYLAYQHNLERRVALKVLASRLAGNLLFCERFLREAKIGASLFHRHIVPVYEGGRFRDQYYLTMEYLPRGDFKQRMDEGCSVGESLRIVYDIACALDYAHAKSFVHQDIKPENILFREDGSAVLTDFGIAEDIKAEVGQLTANKLIVGSPQYMSPEQARGEALDKRADIYSLGAVLYEALSGHPLFDGPASVADAVQHANDPVPRLPSEVSWLQPVMEKMLAKDRDARFASMADVMQALEPCLELPKAFQSGKPEHPPQTSASSPTLIEIEHITYDPLPPFANDRLEDRPATVNRTRMQATRPPHREPPPAPPQRRSHVIMLSVVALLAALPLGMQQWPSALDMLAPQLEHDERPALQPPAQAQSMPMAMTDTPAEPEVDNLKDSAAPDALAPSSIAQLPAPGSIGDHAATTVTEEVEETPADAVARLLAEAGTAMQSAPFDTDAYSQYRQVLKLDPGNKAAQDGIAMVTGRYLDMASAALNQDRLDNAQRYVDRASTLTTRHGLSYEVSQRVADIQFAINRIRSMDGR